LVVESIIEHGEQLPEQTTEEVQVTIDPRVTTCGGSPETPLQNRDPQGATVDTESVSPEYNDSKRK
jgi:hypothetical protein